jgi:CheY-like chemotaxis protein
LIPSGPLRRPAGDGPRETAMGKILVADDHPDILRLVTMSLNAEGHTLLTACNGAEALQMVRDHRPDLLILDVTMPELDGYRVLNRIKTDPELRHTIVMMLTVRDQPEDVALGLDIGADYYVGKPFRPVELASLVRRIFHNLADQEGDGAEPD